jgi:hypothetical protein
VDSDFNTADFLMLLDLSATSSRFARRFAVDPQKSIVQVLAA